MGNVHSLTARYRWTRARLDLQYYNFPNPYASQLGMSAQLADSAMSDEFASLQAPHEALY